MYRSPRFIPAALLALALVSTAVGAGCPGEGGANQNMRQVGDEPGGVRVGLGDIAVSPAGGFVLFRSAASLMVGHPESGEVRPLPVDLPTRVSFAHDAEVIYVGSEADHSVQAIDTAEGEVLWSAPIGNASTELLRLTSTSNDVRVLAGSATTLTILDAWKGQVIRTHEFPTPIVDVVVLPGDNRALVVQEHQGRGGEQNTQISVVELKTGELRHIQVPNCADVIAITADAKHALMAPTICPANDPISVISLENGNEHFVRNLPGFGPVAVAPDGHRAIGFLDAAQIDESLFDDPDQIPPMDGPRYYLMVIDTVTMGFTLHPVGEELPRYSMTNDAKVVLLDSTAEASSDTRIFDLDDGRFHDIVGPAVELDTFVMTSDSQSVYGLDMDSALPLFHVDVPERTSRYLRTNFPISNLNLSADDESLYLRKDDASICVFDLAEEACVSHMKVSADATAVAPTSSRE